LLRFGVKLLRMQISYGYAGWIRADDIDLPGPLYLRLRPDERGRWRVTELYLDGRDAPVTGAMLRQLPLAAIESIAQKDGDDQHLARQDEYPGIQMSVMASHYATPASWPAGTPGEDWLDDMLASQIKRGGAPTPIKRARDPKIRTPMADNSPLSAPGGRVTDEFLRELARRYMALVERGERGPAVTLAKQAHVTVHAVRKWVYMARQRGILPPGRRGQAG
jgi:hypothetical protein